ncbi:hypothetical protein A1O3_04726 [Capronia epimyces CBS 606.96]|uniref:alcohol dehydrogenase (NADP(+)) n=1 Tax=Capronia epimyces CBS 606.96 TaxID=1182542 RepID=W9YP67_9EURO|nr:uncharacterized protein A1O3_04726 [Capronia epimyces CBS 606.96]EXJ84059.1 hypothetical protein A1O3_04726 [Capronia epimyces CBS 606.96]
MAVPKHFTGYGSKSASDWQNLGKIEFEPKPFEEYDVDIKVQFCGVCGSDLHTLSGGWGGTMYPSVVGHEIVGEAVRVGDKVKSVKVGDTVGVGPNAWSCGDCSSCQRGLEQYCPDLVETYNFKYKDGSRSWGGYSNFARINERFVFPVPAEIPPAEVAPLFCAGLTVFSPLKANKIGPGSRVGVVGIGGLGHYAVLFASAMGAAVTAISHSPRKKDDATKLGATSFVVTSEPGWEEAHTRSLDLILCTSFAKDMPLKEYLALLDVGGSLVYVGIPESDLPPLPPTLMVGTNSALRGSNTGSKDDVLEMLELVKAKSIRSWITVHPMSQCAEVVERQRNGEARFRFVLKMDGSLP